MFVKLLYPLKQVFTTGLHAISTRISAWTKPLTSSLVLGSVQDLARSKPQLVAENALLRQQLIVLNRSVKRPRLTAVDRALLVLLASRVRGWKAALLIIKPDTLLRWHRAGFRLFWKQKSHATSREPKIPVETVTLIKEMAGNNRLWGAERIRGELLKVGIKVAKRTVQRYMRQARPARPRRQTWATFLRNHAKDIWACDFVQVHDLFFRPLFAFVITELGSRRIIHVSATRSPSDEWVAQQLREATPFGQAPAYLIRDNDAQYGPHFDAVAVGTRIQVVRTPIKAPRANAICERLLGSVRRECLDHILILGEAHLRRVLKEYARYFNQARPHQGIGQQLPEAEPDRSGGDHGRVMAFPVLGGLHHDYRRAA